MMMMDDFGRHFHFRPGRVRGRGQHHVAGAADYMPLQAWAKDRPRRASEEEVCGKTLDLDHRAVLPDYNRP